MTEQQQAELLARWLDEGGPPPPELDSDAADAMIAFRPDLAGPLSLSVDDILAGVREGPLAAPIVAAPGPLVAVTPRENPMPVGASLGASPDEAPSAGASRSRRPWWIAAMGVGGLGSLAAAAMALVVVGSVALTQSQAPERQDAAPPVAASPAMEAPLDGVAVVDTGAPGDAQDARGGRQRAGRATPRPSPSPSPPKASAPEGYGVASRPAMAPAPTPGYGPAARPASPSEPAGIPELAQPPAERLAARPVDTFGDAPTLDAVGGSAASEAVAFDDQAEEEQAERNADKDAAKSRAIAANEVATAAGRADALEAKRELARGKAAEESRSLREEAPRKQKEDRKAAPASEPAALEKASEADDSLIDSPSPTRPDVTQNTAAPTLADEGTANTGNTAVPPPPALTPAAAPMGGLIAPATSAEAHQGAASADPTAARLRTMGATMGWSRAMPSLEEALAANPGPTALRQELLALKGDAHAALGDRAKAQAAWAEAVAVRVARGG